MGKTTNKAKEWGVRALLLLAVVTLWLGSSAGVTWKLTRRPRPPFAEPAPKVDWADFEAHRLTTADGQQLGAWLVRGDPGRGCAVVLHGNGGSRADMLDVVRLLAVERWTVLAVSLRAHGDSTGATHDFGWSSRHDVTAAVAWLEGTFPGRPIFLVGRSLGAAAAIFAAADLGGRVAGYFLEQPYRDLPGATWNRLQIHLPPVLDWVAYAGLRLWAPVFLPVAPAEVAPCRAVRAIPEAVPVVIAVGSADRHAPLSDAQAVFRPVQSHARLVVFEGAAHQALDRWNATLYRKALLELLARPRPAVDGFVPERVGIAPGLGKPDAIR
jgi:pimeloyl-ACP methyl ester carboxylesterase